MERSRPARNHLARFHNTKTLLTLTLLSVAGLGGFYAGALYATTWMAPKDGAAYDCLATEADYIIFTVSEGLIQARNGSTGRIDYENADASYTINSAIDGLPTTGGYIFIKQGAYTLSETIRIPSNVSLIGAGFGSRLILAADTRINLIENRDPGQGNHNILVANLNLDGNKAENPGQIGGLHFRKVRDSAIQNCWVHDSAFAGLLIEKGGGNTIQNNFVYRNRNAGIEGTHEDHDIVANNVVYLNEGDPYGHGIDYCTGSRWNIFEGNICHNNGLTSGGGLALWDGYENTIIGNTLTSNYIGLTVGIPDFGNETYGNMIIENMVSNNTSDGLHLEGKSTFVSKNAFSFNGGNGIHVGGLGTTNTIIDGNRLTNNQGWQIFIAASPSKTTIRSNYLSGNNLLENHGTNTSIQLNTGYATEGSGTAVIPAGRTNISFQSELVSAPKHISLTPRDNLEGRSYWYTTNSTHITIHMGSPDASKDHWFDWTAEA